MVSFTHEQNSICSRKQLNDIVHEHTIICRSRGGLSANEKEETFAWNDNSFCAATKSSPGRASVHIPEWL